MLEHHLDYLDFQCFSDTNLTRKKSFKLWIYRWTWVQSKQNLIKWIWAPYFGSSETWIQYKMKVFSDPNLNDLFQNSAQNHNQIWFMSSPEYVGKVLNFRGSVWHVCWFWPAFWSRQNLTHIYSNFGNLLKFVLRFLQKSWGQKLNCFIIRVIH